MSAAITGVLLPAALACIMFYLGTTLRAADFAAVATRPRALAVGLAGQLVLVPALGLAVAWGGALEPTLAVGLLVLAACPGGVSSGLLTHLARGDVALSIALTALTSVAAMLSMPLVLDLALRLYTDHGLQVTLPLGPTVARLFVLTVLPVAAGMALRAWRPQAVARRERAAGRIATGLFVAIVLLTFWSQRAVILANLATVGLACALLDALALRLAWALAAACGLARRERIAVATECGLQNAALGIYVAIEVLHTPALAVPSVVYALLMNVGALAFVALVRAGPPAPLRAPAR